MSGPKERRGLPVVGPLGELFPSLRSEPEEVPRAPVHPRVLIADDGGERSLVLVCWDDPGSREVLHGEVRRRVEAALLTELCRPPEALRAGVPLPSAVRLLFFCAPKEAPGPALRAFGLAEVAAGGDLAPALAHVRGEAQRVGREVPDAPTSAWEARLAPPPGERGETLARLEAALLARVGDEPWGERPGAFHAALAASARELGLGSIPPTGEGLDAVERIAIHYTPGPIRAIPPLVFQALCDLVGVVAVREHGRRVEWAASGVDARGVPSPPLLRVASSDGPVHLPIALHLLRWCVMPVSAGEVVPPVSDWVLDQFGGSR